MDAGAGQSGIGTDRSLTLLHLRKKFSGLLRDSNGVEFDKLLPLFNRIMSMYTPDELAGQFKELIAFTQRVCETIVAEIRQHASMENTREAAAAVAAFAQPSPPDARGWVLLKSVAFILNSGMPKVLEPICRSQLPSTLVKAFYLFFDLPPLADADSQEAEIRHKMYDLLVTLMNSLCEYPAVATELIQRDDLNWLFVGASTPCQSDFRIWRDAHFAFLSSILGRALSAPVIKYIHSKGCVGHYLRNCRAAELTAADRANLLCNMLDLLRHSAGTTLTLFDDFKNADGYEQIAALCTSSEANADDRHQLFHALVGLLTAGDTAVQVSAPSAPLALHNFKLPASAAHGAAAVRVPDAFGVLEKCFQDGDNDVCLLVLDKTFYLYKAEKLNYFIIERTHSLHLFVQWMAEKSAVVQEKVLELVEFVLRELNFIPCKELGVLNAHVGRLATAGGGNAPTVLRRYFSFFFRILPVNIGVKDAFRELAILETLLNVVHTFCADWPSVDEERGAVAQMAMDLLVASAKGNVPNAQFITENLEIRVLRAILFPPTSVESWREEFRDSTLLLVKNLLFLAKNEQLFSSLLQLLFAEPGHILLCDVVLKLFTSVLLESHKVRVMFRRSGGYICLMTLLLHVENALRTDRTAGGGSIAATIASGMRHIVLIFQVLTVSMRYEPSNAKYFQTEVKPAIINSILRCLGCFTPATRISNTNRDAWAQVHVDDNRPRLSALHFIFQNGAKLLESELEIKSDRRVIDTVPPQLLYELCVLRLLFDLALDNYEKSSNIIQWAVDSEWLANSESIEAVPLVSFSARTILVHTSAVTCLLQLVPAMSADPRDVPPAATAGGNSANESIVDEPLAGDRDKVGPSIRDSPAEKFASSNSVHVLNINDAELRLWTSTAQFYMALILKALMRIERNQQIMCQQDMPKILLDVGAELFRAERHPLLPPFYYLFERLAGQSMHPRELRRFLRIDRPLCCLNLDDSGDENDNDKENGKDNETASSGGPLPIHRVKALVSMLTPRNHALVHAPAFVEFDLTIEGFACLFAPSISNLIGPSAAGGLSNSERLFPPLNGLTFMTWFHVDDLPTGNGITNVQNSNICLLTIVRNFEGTEAAQRQGNKKDSAGSAVTPLNLENHLTCFYVHLNMMQRCLLISTAEHSIVDELRKDFVRSPETFVRVPLSEQFFQTRQWTHLTVVLSKALLKQSQVDVYVNGRCLLSQRLAYISANVGGAQAQVHDSQPVHAIVGTPPFLRRPSQLRWKIASLYLVEDVLSADVIHQVIRLQPHYIGNLQTMASDGSGGGTSAAIVAEDKLILVLNASSTAELTAHALRPMLGRADCEVIASLLGISANDNSTPLRVLWNTASHASGGPRTLGAVLIGYLGMRTFAPCPVSALLDAIGGAAPLLGLVAMCADAPALYAALKVLTSAVRTNRGVVQALAAADGGARGYQTLAALLEEKAHLINSHILQLVLALAGTTADGCDGRDGKDGPAIADPQTFDDLLCDLDVWASAPNDVKRLLFEHLYELLVDDQATENLCVIRSSSIFGRLLILLYENHTGFPVHNDVLFRLVSAIVQPSPDPEPALILRLGQTISATVACSSRANGDATPRESDLPFHIAELERMLIESLNDEGRDCLIDGRIYSVYLRNRLLNIIATMLAHAEGATHLRLCELLAETLGFGWLLALCAPGINAGTLYLALRILLNLLRYAPLMEKFRDGTANGGWLSDTDSVIRNRAAVLLGFSVSAHGGAVGAKVDVNPELSNCSGFAALEHLMYAHADKPFVYLAMLAILFNRPLANVQPLDEFTVDAIWSHVFGMDEKGSVSDVLAGVQFCGDALIALLAMVRAGVQRQRHESPADDGHYSNSHPLIIAQLLAFLYRNSEPFFAICHTETFVVALFAALAAASSGPPASPTVSADHDRGFSRSVSHMLDLLINIIYDDLSLPHETRTEWPFHALVEYLEGGGGMCGSPSVFYTELVNGCLERLLAAGGGASAPPPDPANVSHLLGKLIDSVWNCLYRGNPIRVLKCALRLAGEAPTVGSNAAHVNALFRIVLYLLSRPIDNVDTQMSVLDTLAEIVRNQQLLLDSRHAANNNSLYYGALVHLVFMLSERPEAAPLAGQPQDNLERGNAQVAMCAQNVWGLLWAQKKALIDELFKRDVDLDLYTARAACGPAANHYWLQFVDAQTDCHGIAGHSSNQSSNHYGSQNGSAGGGFLAAGRATAANVGQLQQNLQSRLSRAAKTGFQRLANRRSLVLGAASMASFSGSAAAPVGTPAPFQFERLKIESETFYMWIRVHISLLRELVATQCQRYHEWHAHVRSWCLKEWQRTEAELTRERGLWGPERRSALDKYELDVTEGPHRIRRKLVPNSAEFYRRYPYRPHLDGADAKALRGKLAVSRDSRAYYERMRRRRFHTMDERIIDRTAAATTVAGGCEETAPAGVELNASTELNLSMIKRMVQKNLARATDVTEKSALPAVAVAADAIDDEVTSVSAADVSSVDGDSEKLLEVTRRDTRETTSEPASPSRNSLGRSTTAAPPQPDSGGSGGGGPDNQTLLRLLEQGEQLHSMFRCARIQGLDTLEGLLLFGRDHYYVVDGFTLLKTREIRDLDFLPEQFHDPIVPYMAMGSSNRPATKSTRRCSKFSYDDIKEVHKRRYLLQPIALEVFSADGRNYLLAFPRKIRDRVFQKFVSMAKSASSDVARTMAEQRKLLPAEAASTGHQLINQLMGQQSMTQKWQRGEISNFHYLVYLNTLAGRSYNDLSQYPVFPWIVADYDSPRLDLTDPRSFRDLSKPMGAQATERLSKFLRRYHEWDDPTGDTPPYMYGTHYSSAMIVLSYLVRLEPFTEQFLKLQGGHFDLADRMFHSIRDAFVSASRNNMADVRELIPEFFYLPEMFLNDNNFDLGVKQNGVALHHVELPAWAHGDAHEFVRLHREALECDYVSEHLHEWIDLIFGYRQSGDPARDAHNVFHHLFYEANVNFDVIDDPLTRNATLGFINNFGQIPSQLFRKPHPQKRVAAASVSPPLAASGQSDSAVAVVPGITTTKLFYHALDSLKVSAKPVKELKAAVGDIVVNDKNQVIVLEQGKIFLPPASYLAWSFNDRSVRMGGVGTEKVKSECVCETSDVYEITCMATADGRTIFVGLTTGTVLVWSATTGHQLAISRTLATRKALDAHTDVVTALAACAPHNFVVSASRDHTAVVWHLTRFAFIRQLDGHPAAVTAVAVNDATGDIATASNALVFVWTVNGTRIATINTAFDAGGLFANSFSVVLCLSFSTMNEWDLNNVIMCGTSDGLVKIYSSLPTLPSGEGCSAAVLPPAAASNYADTAAEVREHILRRQQRIQQHHNQRQMLAGSGQQPSVASVTSVDSASPVGWMPRASVGLSPADKADPPAERTARLRRVLYEHTGFHQGGNALPAPVTSIRPTRDHRSLLVGDGVGRVWLWTDQQR